jgi:UDP-glucose 4-epimerase
VRSLERGMGGFICSEYVWKLFEDKQKVVVTLDRCLVRHLELVMRNIPLSIWLYSLDSAHS